MGASLLLVKLHGAGNDFLVLIDRDGTGLPSSAQVRALCHRRFGIGADGVLRLVPPAADGGPLGMELVNADGSRAEMSGNGIRCLVHAAVDAGLARPGTVEVDTAAGRRTVTFHPGEGPAAGWGGVDMGQVTLGEDYDPAGVAALMATAAQSAPMPSETRARWAEVGNPHLVVLVAGDGQLVGPPLGPPVGLPVGHPLGPPVGLPVEPTLGPPVDEEVLRQVGPVLEHVRPGGANVEFVRTGPGAGELTMAVWERGAGITLACGTGSCAAAAVARAWGLVGDEVTVHNPGGALRVELDRDGTARLWGPSVKVAEVRVDPAALGVPPA